MANFEEQIGILQQMEKAREAIKRKYNSLKLSKLDAEHVANTTFKPIVEPLEKLIDITETQSKVSRKKVIKDSKTMDQRHQVLEELHKPARLIDIFSKYAWAVPIKQKTGKDVAAAMLSILKQGRVPKNLQTDRGKEFYNKEFENLIKRYKIHLYSTYSNLKASICERFNRTLKTRMWKLFSLNGNHKWLQILSSLLNQYNDTKHRTIGIKRRNVTVDPNPLFKCAKFKEGHRVRVSESKQIFEKGYTPNWSTEIFTVDRVHHTSPYTYLLKDYQNRPIAGGFHEEELQKTKCPDVYLIEKVVKKRCNNYYVKWLVFDDTHNSWISKNDL
ncbi:uncharacterized protein LOC116416568 [Nasonia vitripennis]|uniref:Uncharacterized protein n=1 Tax=Nasonia vitripennis TaxID=7425 RepID=A0A7M7Q6Y9_NASVI|nr:uncharacterized protein LOC116416568 [Nasonia vitripennis]